MVDHLHLPAQLAHPLPVIPYVVRSDPKNAYDGLGFSTFPERRGFDKDLLLRGDFGGRSDADLNEFFQSWLFFGMLHEVMTTAGESVDLADFVKMNDNGQSVITTLPLRKHLLNWRERELRDGRSLLWGLLSLFRTPWYDRLRIVDDCLVEAIKFTRTLLSPCALSSLPPARRPALLPEICLSIIILGSTLDRAKNAVVPAYVGDQAISNIGSDALLGQGLLSGQMPYMPRDTMSWGPAAYTIGKLQERRWCPMEVEMLKELSDEGMYYISQMKRPQLSNCKGHEDCTRSKCVAYQVDDESYRSQHRNGCNGCDDISFRTAEVAEVVLRGQIPLIMVEKKGSSFHPLLHYTDGNAYIAISHVWAQGLGNKKANALPKCQFEYIRKLVAEIYGDVDTEVILFWIDTLCVPLEPRDARRKAIARMKEVYGTAHTVLVLDEELQQIPCPFPTAIAEDRASTAGQPDFSTINSNVRELYMRLFIAPWSRRLWTLQEAVLSQNLLIRFADGSYPLQQIVGSKHNNALFDNPYQTADPVPMGFCRDLLGLKGLDLATRLGHVSGSLCYRDTSRLSDEAVCMGGILDLNTWDIIFAGDSTEERMLSLYQQLSCVPLGLLFFDGPKLQDEGFRWAPVSLLGMKFNLTQTLETVIAERILGSRGGLFVSGLGVVFDQPDSPLTSVFYVEDLWRAMLTPGQEDSPMHLLETLHLASSTSSALSPFANTETTGTMSSGRRISYAGTIPWTDLPVVNSDFGIIVQQGFVHAGESGSFKKAVLVNDLQARFQTTGEDGSRTFWEPGEQEGQNGELVISGRFVARMNVELVPLDEWTKINEAAARENTVVLTPMAGGIHSSWIVR